MKNKCIKCKHQWVGRKITKPKYCPSCHSPNWDGHKKRDSIISLILKA